MNYIEYVEEEVREEIFEGTYILDGLRLTEEQQREKIFNLMIQAGVKVTKEEFDTYEIGYEGADDDYGISETQSTKFVVYKTTKERLNENEVIETNDLEQVLNEIKTLRDKLNSIVSDVSKTDIIQELVDKEEKPMKVTDIHVDEFYCPKCHSEISHDKYNSEHPKYCEECGQRLDFRLE